MLEPTSSLSHWLASRTRRDPKTRCLIWQGAIYDGYAYGRLPGGPATKILRSLYQHRHGPLSSGVAVRPACGNRACCELKHAEALPRGAAVLAGQGPCALNARKTACKRGHPFDGANTYVDPSGRRRCRTCMLAQEQSWHAAVGRRNAMGVRKCEIVEAA
jgi:hypothetical protein